MLGATGRRAQPDTAPMQTGWSATFMSHHRPNACQRNFH